MNSEEYKQLEESIGLIWDVASKLGLDPFPVHFEVVPASIMYEFGAYGLPGRFSHWTHGRAYQQMKTMYDYGLSKIYELVVNTNPSYAFLMENNGLLQNKLVVAHVLGHSDFFKNNAYFGHTNRQMIEGAAVNADRIRRYEFEHGTKEVEEFLDSVLSIEEHIDPYVFTRKHKPAPDDKRAGAPSAAYDDLFATNKADEKQPHGRVKRHVPEEPTKDMLLFLADHAPDLDDWQRDVIHMVRAEMLYFLPQMQTKIMNEGWAAYWHVHIMRELELTPQEYVDFADMHSSVLAPSRRSINPYYVGLKIFEDIEKRWDKPTDDEATRLKRAGQEGRAKMFEVRSMESDESFLRNYLTKDLVDDLDLYTYELKDDKWVIVDTNWEHVRDNLVDGMTNFGHPYIVVTDGDHNGNSELYLEHRANGKSLDLGYAEKTLEYVHKLWGRPVHLSTIIDGESTVMSYNGRFHSRTA